MIANKVLLNSDLERQIKLFYKVSVFLNKYSVVVFAFLLSLVFIFSSFYGKSNVVNYSTDLLATTSVQHKYIGYDVDKVNKIISPLETDLVLTKTYKKGPKLYLGIGSFFNDNGLYYPSNISFPIFYLSTGALNKKAIIRYFGILHRTQSYNTNKKMLKNIKKLSKEDMIKEFNLSCMSSILNNTYFCNHNKYLLIDELTKTKSFDLEKGAYDYLFSNIFLSNEEKCDMLKGIFTNKLNYKQISDVIKICNDPSQFLKAYEIVNISNNLFSPDIPKTYEAKIIKLVNQWRYLLVNKVSPDTIVSHLAYVKNLLSNYVFTKYYAYGEYLVLRHINIKYSSKLNDAIKNNIKSIIYGDTLSNVGLKRIAGDLIGTGDDNGDIIVANMWKIESVREKLINLLKSNAYSDIFILSKKVKFNQNKNVAEIEGQLKLSAKIGEKNAKYSLPIYFEVPLNSILGTKFKIINIKILDNKISKFINSKGINLSNISDLYSLSDKLSLPIINFIQNGGKQIKIGLCDKFSLLKFQGASCKGNTISVSVQSRTIRNQKFKFVFSGFELSEIILPKYVEYVNDKKWMGKEDIKVSLTTLNKKLNDYIKGKGLSLDSVSLLTSKIVSYIKNYIKGDKIKQRGLTDKQLIKLNSLFKKYLGTNISYVVHVKDSYYRVYFSLGGYKFVSLYDYSKNSIIAFEIVTQSKKFEFKNVNLSLSNLDIEKLNNFKLNPDSLLKKIDEKEFVKLKEYLNKNK